MRTLRVRELCRHDRDMSPVNNQYRNLDANIGSYIFYEDIYRSTRITTYVVPFIIDMLLAQDSIVGISIPSSISLPASLFTHSVTHHPATNSLVAMLARLKWCALPSGPRDTSPTIGVTNPNLEIPTQQVPSETPIEHLCNHPVTLWRLVAHKAFLRYLGVA